jgi:CheY-like chemotaxis protein
VPLDAVDKLRPRDCGGGTCEPTSPEALLCDIGPPDIVGYSAVREIRAREHVQAEDIMRAKRAGFDARRSRVFFRRS